MTANEFRQLALSFPEATEKSHMGHPDFRVAGKIFATLGAKKGCGMVKLTPEQQPLFLQSSPAVFVPVNGAWGRRGCTFVTLSAAKTSMVREALSLAWQNTAPQSLVQQHDETNIPRKRSSR